MEQKGEITIGLLGLGSRSTLFYLDALHKTYHDIKKGYSTCPLVMYQADFNDFNPYLPGQFDRLEPRLKHHIDQIKKFGANYLLIPNITLHQTFDKLDINMPIAHPIKLTIDKLKANNQSKAVVFGSKYTMNADYIRRYFEDNNIELVTPNASDMKLIDCVRTQQYFGQEKTQQQEDYQKLVMAYAQKHAVVMACTELSLLAYPDDGHLYDMAKIQIEETVRQKLINDYSGLRSCFSINDR